MLKIKEISDGFLVYKEIEGQEYSFVLFYKMAWTHEDGEKVWLAEWRAEEYVKYLKSKKEE